MQMRNCIMILAPVVAFGSFASPASAEQSVVPFIVQKHYKENISLDQFRYNERKLYRSEEAFQLSRQYAERVVGQSLTDGEFIALLRSDQTRTRICPTSEVIRTGALQGNNFYWIDRSCRVGEEIIQFNVSGQWKDFTSLNCLNAVEDQNPVPPPQLVYVPPTPPVYLAPPPSTIITYTDGVTIGGTFYEAGCYCCNRQSFWTPGLTIQGSYSQTTTF